MTEQEIAIRILCILGACRDDMSAESVEAFQELADELRAAPSLVTVKPLNLGASVSTGTRKADD